MTESTGRLTPYELVFGDAEVFESERFPEIREEIEKRGAGTADPDAFVLLGTVGSLLRDIMPEEDLPKEARSELFRRHGRLLHQAYHFWAFGRRAFAVDRPVIRYLVETSPRVGDWRLRPPAPAGYLQLPRHLFWGRIEPDAPPEPIDGFFWTMIGTEAAEDPPYARLDLLLALGMRPGRPGFASIDVGAPLDAGEEDGDGGDDDAPVHWAHADARPGGADFENVLPGGEIEGLYAITTPTEALKLASLCFWYIDRHPEALVGASAESVEAIETTETPGGAEGTEAAEAARDTESAEEPPDHRMPPSGLDFTTARLEGAD